MIAKQRLANAHFALQLKNAGLNSALAGSSAPTQERIKTAVEAVVAMRDACSEWMQALELWVESHKDGGS